MRKSIGKQILKGRIANYLTQKELAKDMANRLGRSPGYIYKLLGKTERGEEGGFNESDAMSVLRFLGNIVIDKTVSKVAPPPSQKTTREESTHLPTEPAEFFIAELRTVAYCVNSGPIHDILVRHGREGAVRAKDLLRAIEIIGEIRSLSDKGIKMSPELLAKFIEENL